MGGGARRTHDPRIPQATVNAIYQRAAEYVIWEDGYHGPVCEDCWCRNGPLELHHLRYFTEGGPHWPDDVESIHGIETPDDLALLCRRCHHSRHLDLNGEYWRDPEEMADYWSGYYWAMDKDD